MLRSGRYIISDKCVKRKTQNTDAMCDENTEDNYIPDNSGTKSNIVII